MRNTNTVNQQTSSHLAEARALVLPSRQEMLQRAPSVQSFWHNNRTLLAQAWQEWEKSNIHDLDDSIVDEKLRSAIERAWQDPNSELNVHELCEEVAPGVFTFQLFSPEKLVTLREYFESAADANIPLRPPYGIVLNRRGAMLDPRSEGFLAGPTFQAFYQQLMDKYMRPIARLLFPEIMGYDTQTFGFSIQYQAGMDTSLRLHTDASAVTLNVNLNLPGEEFTGSEVDFYDKDSGSIKRLNFTPGSAMIHLGSVAHAAQPITSGERTNLVFWLYGDRGQIPSRRLPAIEADAQQRWTVPTAEKDVYAPF